MYVYIQLTTNLRTRMLDFRGFDSGIILILRGGALMSIGKCWKSTNLSRGNRSREIGHTHSRFGQIGKKRIWTKSGPWNQLKHFKSGLLKDQLSRFRSGQTWTLEANAQDLPAISGLDKQILLLLLLIMIIITTSTTTTTTANENNNT